MKYQIQHKDKNTLLTIVIFSNIEQAKEEKNKYTNFWKKFNRENPTNKSPRFSAWKNAKIVPIESFDKRFIDNDLVFLTESKRRNNGNLTEILTYMDESKKQSQVNRYLHIQSSRKRLPL